MRRFSAHAVAAVELPEYETFTVVLAENADGDGERLELHKAFSFDEQDRLLGMDTYCLRTEAGTTYGGVTSWTLTQDALEVRLDEKTAALLGVEGGFLVSFPREYLQTLREGLGRVLGSTSAS
jgi:hypothetical protein